MSITRTTIHFNSDPDNYIGLMLDETNVKNLKNAIKDGRHAVNLTDNNDPSVAWVIITDQIDHIKFQTISAEEADKQMAIYDEDLPF